MWTICFCAIFFLFLPYFSFVMGYGWARAFSHWNYYDSWHSILFCKNYLRLTITKGYEHSNLLIRRFCIFHLAFVITNIITNCMTFFAIIFWIFIFKLLGEPIYLFFCCLRSCARKCHHRKMYYIFYEHIIKASPTLDIYMMYKYEYTMLRGQNELNVTHSPDNLYLIVPNSRATLSQFEYDELRLLLLFVLSLIAYSLFLSKFYTFLFLFLLCTRFRDAIRTIVTIQ